MKADFFKNWGTASLILAGTLFVGGAIISNCALSITMWSLSGIFALVAIHHYIRGSQLANWEDYKRNLPIHMSGLEEPCPDDFLWVFFRCIASLFKKR